MRLFVLSAICALALLSIAKADNPVGHPIAVVPGILGSALHATVENVPKGHVPLFCPRNHKEFSIWFNPLFDFDVSCFRFYFKTNFSAEDKTWENTQGVTISVPKEGTMYAIDMLDEDTTKHFPYFHDFIKTFEGYGYQDGVNMTACGYDWRHDPSDEWAAKCRGFIEKMVETSGKKAIVIGHSMGGPYSYYLLKTAPAGWTDKYVHKYVTPCPAWLGAARALDAMFSGLGHDLPEFLSKLFAPLARNLPAVWFLIPWMEAFKGIPIVQTPHNNYTCDDIAKVFTLKGVPDADLRYKTSRSVFASFNNYDEMPNVPMITTYGTDSKTMQTLVFDEELSAQDPDGYWKEPKSYLYGPGDGTVCTSSLSYPTDKWMKKYPDRNITYVPADGTSHIGIVTSPAFMEMIRNEAFNDY